MPEKVRRLVREGVQRSASVAWETRPRDLRTHEQSEGPRAGHGQRREGEVPHWGIISHPGWSSPDSPDLPYLHLPPIILELPHLIEAKAVSLAPNLSYPQEPSPPTQEAEEPHLQTPSPLAISLLQRPATSSLRDYLTHLSTLGLINPASLLPTFLTAYETARFSPTTSISEPAFRTLMSIFASLLRGMQSLDPALVAELRATEEAEAEEIARYDGAEGSSVETTSTVAHNKPYPSSRSDSLVSSGHSPQPESQDGGSSSSSGSLVHERRRGLRTPSIATLRSIRSRASSVLTGDGSVGAGSVIHLADAAGPLELPYRIDSQGS